MTGQATVSLQLDPRRLHTLIQREERTLDNATQRSAELYRRGRQALSGGVASSFQVRRPWPIYLAGGRGPAVWDVDGHRRLDFHNGFGAMVHGHAHPVIGRVVRERYARGTHFAAPTEDAIVVGEELARRWGLPRWRYTNSGSESTMDAIRIARGFTGREVVLKAIGSYHGHHDAVLAPGITGPDQVGGAASAPAGGAAAPDAGGIPAAVARLTVAVPFNDAEAIERAIACLDRQGSKPACVILEPAMMLGMILPEPGYLEAVREITSRHGVVLIFDEVKSGLAIGAAGATGRYGVRPDLVTLAKALGAGMPCGAVGGSEDVMSVVEDGSVYQVGTFNGNALAMAAARASLLEVLTPGAYQHLERLSQRMTGGCQRTLDRHSLPGYALGTGARGCVTLAASRITDHVTFQAAQNPELSRLIWLYYMNRGVFATPARPEQWTLSIAHADAEVDAYLAVHAALLAELTPSLS
jgi:glutamate-1-semialdehyde 2,1-aminomutase